MPAKEFIIPEKIRKSVHKLPFYIYKRLPDAFLHIKLNPLVGVKLRGELSGCYKYRVGDYRIIYRFHSKAGLVEVVKIEHRQGVYR